MLVLFTRREGLDFDYCYAVVCTEITDKLN